jgi:hypothetical protein
MTLAQITALIAANIDITGRRLTTGVRMREVLNGIVAYLTGVPDFVYTGLVFSSGQLVGLLGMPIDMAVGGDVSLQVLSIFSRGKNWGDIPVSGSGDSEFTENFIPSQVASDECVIFISLTFDSSVEGIYTYDITVGGITKTLTIEVEGA